MPKHILLIEDDEDDQFSFIDALKTVDNTVLQYLACNGKEALEYLSRVTILPDLIFSDIDMPILNGIQCLKEIINNPRTSSIPVVMLSTDTTRAALALSLGAKAYIDKPSNLKYLHREIEQVINRYAET